MIRCQIDSIKTTKTVLIHFLTSVVTGVKANKFQLQTTEVGNRISQANVPPPIMKLAFVHIQYSEVQEFRYTEWLLLKNADNNANYKYYQNLGPLK